MISINFSLALFVLLWDLLLHYRTILAPWQLQPILVCFAKTLKAHINGCSFGDWAAGIQMQRVLQFMPLFYSGDVQMVPSRLGTVWWMLEVWGVG